MTDMSVNPAFQNQSKSVPKPFEKYWEKDWENNQVILGRCF